MIFISSGIAYYTRFQVYALFLNQIQWSSYMGQQPGFVFSGEPCCIIFFNSHLLRGELGLEMISKTARWIYFLFFSKVPCQNIRTSTEGFSPKNFGSFKKCEKLGFLAILAIFGGSHIIFWKTALTIFLIFGKKLLLDKGKKVTEPDFS